MRFRLPGARLTHVNHLVTGSWLNGAMTVAQPALDQPTPSTRHAGHAHGHRHGHHRGSFHTHVQHAARAPVSADAKAALQTAMGKEGVPASWESGLQFIMQRESGGQTGVANKTDSARGLFQLTRASYHHNPNGAASFGNPVEEAQGGIRYIQERYQSADNAVAFWQRHGWY